MGVRNQRSHHWGAPSCMINCHFNGSPIVGFSIAIYSHLLPQGEPPSMARESIVYSTKIPGNLKEIQGNVPESNMVVENSWTKSRYLLGKWSVNWTCSALSTAILWWPGNVLLKNVAKEAHFFKTKASIIIKPSACKSCHSHFFPKNYDKCNSIHLL